VAASGQAYLVAKGLVLADSVVLPGHSGPARGEVADCYDDVVSWGTSRTPSTRIALTMVSKLGFPSFESAL